MKKLKKTERRYPGTDSFMCESARILHGILGDDLLKFTAFDSTIDAGFRNDFLKAIEAADSVTDDNTVVAIHREKVERVNALMERSGRKYADVMYFARKAFSSRAMLKRFGAGDYPKAKYNRIRMLSLLENLETACGENRAALNAVGFTDNAISEIATLKVLLNEALTEKNTEKKGRVGQLQRVWLCSTNVMIL
ncbi:hypothetical protein [Flavobacterium sp. 3HN19-14]|uniref:hypothetical protein n=1 Tax=Flavobacterium sp. 3HN19-14 TaxID=3448133 RepID=UPI003EDEE78E